MTTYALPVRKRYSGQRTASPLEAPVGLRRGTVAPIPVDANILFSHCLGSVSFALTLLDELAANGAHQVDAIIRHAANRDPLAAAEAAHSLRGAAGILLGMAHELHREMDRCLAVISNLRFDRQRHAPSPN